MHLPDAQLPITRTLITLAVTRPHVHKHLLFQYEVHYALSYKLYFWRGHSPQVLHWYGWDAQQHSVHSSIWHWILPLCLSSLLVNAGMAKEGHFHIQCQPYMNSTKNNFDFEYRNIKVSVKLLTFFNCLPILSPRRHVLLQHNNFLCQYQYTQWSDIIQLASCSQCRCSPISTH